MALQERRVYRSLNEKFPIAGYNATEVVACYFGFTYGVAFKGFLAGIEDFHGLRHTYAWRLVTAGVDLAVLRELLGHADVTGPFATRTCTLPVSGRRWPFSSQSCH